MLSLGSFTVSLITNYRLGYARVSTVEQDPAAQLAALTDWSGLLTAEDRRGLTPLFWQHVLPYGEFKLDMTSRLSIRTGPPAT